MIKQKKLQSTLEHWAKTLPYRVKIYIFGSYLKGKSNPRDIDIALELLSPMSKDDRTLLWCRLGQKWEDDLKNKTGENIHLSLFEGADSPQMQRNLKGASMLLYVSSGIHEESENG